MAAPRKGIVVIHGVGTQRESDTLLDIGGPLLNFVHQWAECRSLKTHFQRTGLPFSPIDEGIEKPPPHTRLVVSHYSGESVIDWTMAETWWSYSVRQPSIKDMAVFGWTHALLGVGHLVEAAVTRLDCFIPRQVPQNDPNRHPRYVVRFVNGLNSLLWLVATIVGAIFALPVLGVVTIVLLVPIAEVQNFAAVQFLRQLVLFNASQFKTFLQDEIQAANMRARLEKTVKWLAGQECNDIYVIAHSEGCVVALDALCHPVEKETECVRKLFTLGAGLNLAWKFEPNERRLLDQLPPNVRWVDFWTSYDPVPGGPLRWTRANDFAEVEPVGSMSLLGDHGSYWSNTEEVLTRLAQEIDEPNRTDSPRFFVNDEFHTHLAHRRWERVTVLAGARLIGLVLFAAVVVANWNALPAVWDAVWAEIVGAPFGKEVIERVAGWIQTLVGFSGGWVYRLFGAALLALPFLAVHAVARFLLWEWWESREAREAVRLIADSV